MATIHRILLCVVDTEEYPDDSVLHAIACCTSGVRILEHDTVKTAWTDDHFLNGGITAANFEQWFSRALDTPPTVQTAISLIRCAPEGIGDKQWMVDNILPLLLADRFGHALALIEAEDSPGLPRPFLVAMVYNILRKSRPET